MNKQQCIEKIGIIIRNFREENFLTQEELSFRCGIHRNQISLIERGKCDLKASTLLVLCNVLQIPLNQFEEIKSIIKIENELL